MSAWFSAQVVQTGRLPLFCFFVAFVCGFVGIRMSVRLIRARACAGGQVISPPAACTCNCRWCLVSC